MKQIIKWPESRCRWWKFSYIEICTRMRTKSRQSCPTLCDLMDCNQPGSPVYGISHFPTKNTGVGCHFLLQGIFPTQRWNPHLFRLLHRQADSLPLSHLGWLRPTKQFCFLNKAGFAFLKKQKTKKSRPTKWLCFLNSYRLHTQHHLHLGDCSFPSSSVGHRDILPL